MANEGEEVALSMDLRKHGSGGRGMGFAYLWGESWTSLK